MRPLAHPPSNRLAALCLGSWRRVGLVVLVGSLLVGACAPVPGRPPGTLQPAAATVAADASPDWRQRPAPPDPRWDLALYWVYLADRQGEIEVAARQVAVWRDGRRVFISLTADGPPEAALTAVSAVGGQVTSAFHEHINAYVPADALPRLVGHGAIRRLWVPQHRTPGQPPAPIYPEVLATIAALPPDRRQLELLLYDRKNTLCPGLASGLSALFVEPDRDKVVYQLGHDYRDGLVEVAFQMQGEEGDLARHYHLRDVIGFHQYREGRVPLALLCEFAKDSRVVHVGRVARSAPAG